MFKLILNIKYSGKNHLLLKLKVDLLIPDIAIRGSMNIIDMRLINVSVKIWPTRGIFECKIFTRIAPGCLPSTQVKRTFRVR